MPLIDTQTNVRITPEKEAILKSRLGEAITIFPGKTEQWLMLRFTDDCRMWFRGQSDLPLAMVEVKLLGRAERAVCDRATAEICRMFEEELGLAPEHVYVNYTFSDTWGWNGSII